jgi:hypothetical protein
MKFDSEGHAIWTPIELYDLARKDSRRLVDDYLMSSTPQAFSRYSDYCDFLEAISERTGIHRRSMYLRGSCHIGFSVAPKPKVWTEMHDKSDLDLVIVDEAYFARMEREVEWWERRNPAEFLQGRASEAFVQRQTDRQFNCYRDEALPAAICVHHSDTMRRVADQKHCGLRRHLSAFIYPDWYSARRRYQYDLDVLIRRIEAGPNPLPRPEEHPFPLKGRPDRAAASVAESEQA